MTSLPRLAVLDDYQSVSAKYFSPLTSQLDITYIPSTLPSFSHPATTQSQKDELVTRLKPYTIISSMRERTPFPADLLRELPNLRLLLTTGMRNAAIDLVAAKELGIVVTGAGKKHSTGNAEGIKKKRRGPDSTTQHTVALILGIARNLAQDSHNLSSPGDNVWQTSLATSLSGKTFATLGLGRLGGSVAKIMYESFGMDVICWSSSLTQDAADQKATELGLQPTDEGGEKVFKVVSKEELFRQADVLSVHYVLSERSKHIVGKQELSWLKETAFLVNTSRGPLVDEDALLDLLEKGGIAGAAVDVFEIEPLEKESRWRSNGWGRNGRSKVLLTPHMGYVEGEGLGEWYEDQVEILGRWIRGEELRNVLS